MRLSHNEQIKKFWSHVIQGGPDECWGWTGLSLSHGYGQMLFHNKMWRAHRIAWVLTNGPIPRGLCICHHCDNPICTNPSHLFIATQLDNIHDMRQKGRGTKPPNGRGALNNNTKFSDNDVMMIRARYSAGQGYRTIAKDYNVSHTAIRDIVKRKTWSHIPLI
jgi:hypothetical protein